MSGEVFPGLSDGDFAIAFSTNFMLLQLKNNPKIVFIDSTHNICKYSAIELTTLMVKDENGHGFPVSFLLSNRKDQKIFEIFFENLKRKTGELNVQFFLSDDDIKFYNAWTTIMTYKPKRLLCIWHVLRNWHLQGISI